MKKEDRVRLAHKGRLRSSLACLGALVALGVAPSLPGSGAQAVAQEGQDYGVYLRLVEHATGHFDDAVSALRRGLGESDWAVLADYEIGVNRDKCSYRGHVFVVHSPAYAAQVVKHGAVAAFALPLRLAVYQDENGTHVALANPQSLTRTMVAEAGFETSANGAVDQLKAIVTTEVPGKAVANQYGQMRNRGLISKTMGIIAGGPFDSKIEKIESVDLEAGQSVSDVAALLYAGLEKLGGSRRWGIRPIYTLSLPEHDMAIIGVTGEKMEAKSFDIVRHGSDNSREDLACPGLDHAAAFPLELVLTRVEDKVEIRAVDAMFRMKIYFEDAGKMKFAANMRMAPSIEDEIRDKVEEWLE
jgi:uncharacterized protein (DUF302 family)